MGVVALRSGSGGKEGCDLVGRGRREVWNLLDGGLVGVRGEGSELGSDDIGFDARGQIGGGGNEDASLPSRRPAPRHFSMFESLGSRFSRCPLRQASTRQSVLSRRPKDLKSFEPPFCVFSR